MIILTCILQIFLHGGILLYPVHTHIVKLNTLKIDKILKAEINLSNFDIYIFRSNRNGFEQTWSQNLS